MRFDSFLFAYTIGFFDLLLLFGTLIAIGLLNLTVAIAHTGLFGGRVAILGVGSFRHFGIIGFFDLLFFALPTLISFTLPRKQAGERKQSQFRQIIHSMTPSL